jgi:O-antigen ligase
MNRLEAIWLTIAALVPLWVNLWADQPFELSKALLFRSLAWLLGGLWLATWVVGRDDPRPHLRRNRLLVPIGLLAVLLLLSTIRAVNPMVSLLGTVVRGQGLLTLLSYLLLFLVVTSQLRSTEQVQRLLIAMVASALVVVPLSLLQAAGWDPVGLISDARTPIYATLGRANFVGAYLAILVPLTLALALLAGRGRVRGWLILLLGGEVIVIALTLTRGAWLAAGTSLAILGLLWLWPRLAGRQRSAVVVGSTLTGLTGLTLGAVWLIQSPAGSVAARRTIWGAVARLVGDRPLWGYGPDALGLVFPRVYPPELVYYQGRELAVDRAHNLLLDWTVTLGIPGALALCAVLACFFALGLGRLWSATRTGPGAARLDERGIVLAACIAAVAGHLAGTMVSFDVTATAVATWLLLAVVSSPAMAPAGGRDRPRPAEVRPSLPLPAWPRRLAAGVLLLAAGMAIVQLNARPLLASVAHQTAVRHAAAGHGHGAMVAAGRAVRLWPWEPTHHWLLGQVTWHEAERAGDGAAWARAEAALLAGRDLQPEQVTAWVLLGDFYAAVGSLVDSQAFALAHGAYEQAIALAPHQARLYVAWGQVFLAEERPATALAHFYRAVDLDATDGLAFRLIGDVELAEGRPEAALAAYQEAVRWSPEAALAHLGLARSYAALGELAAAQAALAQAVALDPHHPAVRAVQQALGTAP